MKTREPNKNQTISNSRSQNEHGQKTFGCSEYFWREIKYLSTVVVQGGEG